jgi:antirestriction protein ArdC
MEWKSMHTRDAYDVITERIVQLLEAATVPRHKPWDSETGMPKNLNSGKPYRGIKVFMQ